MAVWDPASDDGRSIGPGAVPADLVVDTVEALQARRDGRDRDALRGTIDPVPRYARSQRRAGMLGRDGLPASGRHGRTPFLK